MTDPNSHLSQVLQNALSISSLQDRDAYLNDVCVDDPKLRQKLDLVIGSISEAGVCSNSSLRSAIGKTIDLPNVSLAESPTEGIDPIVRPTSAEIPRLDPESRYQIQGEIARGGMGAILKGRDIDLGRSLAVKVLLDAHKNNPDVVQRFVEEAQIGGQLQHPGIAPVYELGEFADRRPFFAMKLVKGKTLAAMLADRKHPADERSKFLGIFEQVCQTLAYVHSRGVIHRDLKPANIMVGAFGEVQLMDWGLAKVLSMSSPSAVVDRPTSGQSEIHTRRKTGGSSAGTANASQSETQIGSVMGTPAYMPQEQALGEVDRLDQRSDVFGLGAILCEILTGKPPYVAEDSTELYRMAARGQLENCLDRLEKCDADEELIAITTACLSNELADRPRSAEVVAARLTQYLESVDSRLRTAEQERAAEATRAAEARKRRHVTFALAATILVTVGLAGGGLLWTQNERTRHRVSTTSQINEAINEAKLQQGLAEDSPIESKVHFLERAAVAARNAVGLAKPSVVDSMLRASAVALLEQVQQQNTAASEESQQIAIDRKLQERLEWIRLSHADGDEKLDVTESDQNFDADATHRRYSETFAEAGIDIDKISVAEAAERIRSSNVRESLIASLDHWSRAAPNLHHQQRLVKLIELNHWERAAAAGIARTAADPNNGLGRLSIAPLLVLSDDLDRYHEYCESFIQWGEKHPRSAGLVVNACLMAPGIISLDRIPSGEFEAAFEGGPTSPWAWLVRGLLEHRRGNHEQAIEFCRRAAKELPGELRLVATSHAIIALSQIDLDLIEQANDTLAFAEESIHALTQHDVMAGSRDRAIALCLFREAYGKLNEKAMETPVRVSEMWATSDTVPFAIRHEAYAKQLLAIADEADESEWRKSLRRAVAAGDVTELKRLASDDSTKAQPSELVSWLGAALRSAKEIDASVSVLREGQQRDPGDFWLNYELAKSLSKQGNPIAGVGFARAALAVRPKSTGAMWVMVAALDEAGQTDESLQMFKTALDQTEMSGSDYVQLGTDLHFRGKLRQAILAIERAIALGQQDRVAYTELAKLRSAVGEHDRAIEAARQAVKIAPDDTWSHFYLGFALGNSGRKQEAIQPYRDAIRYDSGNAAAYNNLGNILRNDDEHLNEAVELLRTAIRLAGDNHYNRRNSEVNLRYALQALMKRDGYSSELRRELRSLFRLSRNSDQATITQYLEVLEYNPRDWGTRMRLVRTLLNANRVGEAIENLEILLDQNPEDVWAHGVIAGAYERVDDIDRAIKHYSRAVDLDPNNQDFQLSLAESLLQSVTGSGRKFRVGNGKTTDDVTESEKEVLESALTQYRKAMKLYDADHPPVRLGMATTLRLLGRDEEAAALHPLGPQADPNRVAAPGRQSQNGGLPGAISLWRAGKSEDAIRWLQQIVDDGAAKEVTYLMLGRILDSEDRGNEAAEVYRELIRIYPDNYFGYAQLGRYLAEQGKPKESLEMMRSGLKYAAENKGDPTMNSPMSFGDAPALVHRSIGKVLWDQGKLDDAIEAYRKGTDGVSSAHVPIATILWEQGKHADAIKACRTALLETGLDWPQAKSLLARILIDRRNEEGEYEHLAEARKLAEEACRARGRRPLGRKYLIEFQDRLATQHCTLAMVHYRAKEFDAAVSELDIAAENGFDQPEYLILRAMTHWQLAEKKRARELYDGVAATSHDEWKPHVKRLFAEATKLISEATSETPGKE